MTICVRQSHTIILTFCWWQPLADAQQVICWGANSGCQPSKQEHPSQTSTNTNEPHTNSGYQPTHQPSQTLSSQAINQLKYLQSKHLKGRFEGAYLFVGSFVFFLVSSGDLIRAQHAPRRHFLGHFFFGLSYLKVDCVGLARVG